MKSNRYIKLSLVVYLYFLVKFARAKYLFRTIVLELQKAKQKALAF